MFKKVKFLKILAGLGLLLGGISGANSPLYAAESHTRETLKSTQFQRIEQPFSNKMAVTLGGLGLIGLELWWFLLSKSKSRPATTSGRIQEVTITVDGGYEPSQITVQVGQPVRLNFYRKDASSCLEEVRLSDFHIVRELPLNQTTSIDFTPDKPGNYEFTCGMNMFRGRIEVQSAEVSVQTPLNKPSQGSSPLDSIPLTKFREKLSPEVLDSKGSFTMKELNSMTLQLKIPKLACSSCVKRVTEAVKTVDMNATIEADTKTKLVRVETSASETAIKQAIAAVGYPIA